MHQLTFYPLGNADCCLIELNDGRRMICDFANTHSPEDPSVKHIDLAEAMREDLARTGRDHVDVLAFTHLDKDHVQGTPEFFHLKHAAKYQGAGRVHFDEMWVPSGAITDTTLEFDDSRIIQAEARHRLRTGQGIRVFSRPGVLREWLAERGLTVQDREHLFVDAGRCVPGFDHGEVEVFVHSPFAAHSEGEQRNEANFVFHISLDIGTGTPVGVLMTADSSHEIWAEIVRVTEAHGNLARLSWDVLKVPHHCSYLSLSDEKGNGETEPKPEIKRLLEMGGSNGYIVATCKPIPSDPDEPGPPYIQAARCYKRYARAINGEFVVTTEHPTVDSPTRLVIWIDGRGPTLRKPINRGPTVIVKQDAPRAGS